MDQSVQCDAGGNVQDLSRQLQAASRQIKSHTNDTSSAETASKSVLQHVQAVVHNSPAVTDSEARVVLVITLFCYVALPYGAINLELKVRETQNLVEIYSSVRTTDTLILGQKII